MKKNGGFTYPLTLCLLILFLSLFTFHIEHLLTEKKMQNELALLLQEDYYFLSSVKKVENMYQTTGSVPSKGTFHYKNGSMDYQAEPPAGTLQKINFALHLSTGGQINGQGYFDTNLKALKKWLNY